MYIVYLSLSYSTLNKHDIYDVAWISFSENQLKYNVELLPGIQYNIPLTFNIGNMRPWNSRAQAGCNG